MSCLDQRASRSFVELAADEGANGEADPSSEGRPADGFGTTVLFRGIGVVAEAVDEQGPGDPEEDAPDNPPFFPVGARVGIRTTGTGKGGRGERALARKGRQDNNWTSRPGGGTQLASERRGDHDL
jgi:hypothetical protein